MEQEVATCLVCRKHRGEVEVPGSAIYQDKLLFASHMIIPNGQAKSYLGVLFIEPKRHAAGFEDLTDDEARAIGLLTSRLSRALKTATRAEHIYLHRIGHHVGHLHLWLVPRYPGTPPEFWGLKVDEWPGAPFGGPVEIAELCDRVRAELARN